jgi:hypothetical protein
MFLPVIKICCRDRCALSRQFLLHYAGVSFFSFLRYISTHGEITARNTPRLFPFNYRPNSRSTILRNPVLDSYYHHIIIITFVAIVIIF